MGVKFIPDGYHTVTPYLTVRNAPKVIEFLMQAFGAKLSHDAIKRPDGSIATDQGDEVGPMLKGELERAARLPVVRLILNP